MKEQVIQIPDTLEVKEIKDGKIILVEKEKKLTYEDVAKELFFNKTIFYIDTFGKVEKFTEEYSVYNYLDVNNATSEKQLRKLLAINKLMNIAKYLNDGWQPDWNDTSQCKYYIFIDNVPGKLIDIAINMQMQGSDIYFKSKKVAKQAIDILGEETIRLALCTDY